MLVVGLRLFSGIILVRIDGSVVSLGVGLLSVVLVNLSHGVMGVGWRNIMRMGVVVCAFRNDVVVIRHSDSEVLRLVLLVLVMESVILVAVDVLRSHVMMGGVHVVVGHEDLLRVLCIFNVSESDSWAWLTLG